MANAAVPCQCLIRLAYYEVSPTDLNQRFTVAHPVHRGASKSKRVQTEEPGMANKVEDIRNIAIVGHGSAGKTTLVDHLLVKTGAVNANPSVDERNQHLRLRRRRETPQV